MKKSLIRILKGISNKEGLIRDICYNIQDHDVCIVSECEDCFLGDGKNVKELIKELEEEK